MAVGFAHGFFYVLMWMAWIDGSEVRKMACSNGLRVSVVGCKDGVRTRVCGLYIGTPFERRSDGIRRLWV